MSSYPRAGQDAVYSNQQHDTTQQTLAARMKRRQQELHQTSGGVQPQPSPRHNSQHQQQLVLQQQQLEAARRQVQAQQQLQQQQQQQMQLQIQAQQQAQQHQQQQAQQLQLVQQQRTHQQLGGLEQIDDWTYETAVTTYAQNSDAVSAPYSPEYGYNIPTSSNVGF